MIHGSWPSPVPPGDSCPCTGSCVCCISVLGPNRLVTKSLCASLLSPAAALSLEQLLGSLANWARMPTAPTSPQRCGVCGLSSFGPSWLRLGGLGLC